MRKDEYDSILRDIADKVIEIRKPVANFYWIMRKEVRAISNMGCFENIEYIPTPFEIAKYYGIGYVFENIDGDMPSFLTYDPTIIHITDRYTENNYKARILCAHELGHYFLHEDQISAMNNDSLNLFLPEENLKEYQANVFSIFLMPQIMGGQPWETFSINKLNRIVYEKTIEREDM